MAGYRWVVFSCQAANDGRFYVSRFLGTITNSMAVILFSGDQMVSTQLSPSKPPGPTCTGSFQCVHTALYIHIYSVERTWLPVYFQIGLKLVSSFLYGKCC